MTQSYVECILPKNSIVVVNAMKYCRAWVSGIFHCNQRHTTCFRFSYQLLWFTATITVILVAKTFLCMAVLERSLYWLGSRTPYTEGLTTSVTRSVVGMTITSIEYKLEILYPNCFPDTSEVASATRSCFFTFQLQLCGGKV